MKKLSFAVCLLGLACASPSNRLSDAPLEPTRLTDAWSLLVVTEDPDGAERVTRIWVAVLDDDPVIRTGESRWWKNLERDPAIRIRLSGTDYPFAAEPVVEHEEKVRIDQSFLEKYGGWERLLFSQERGETHDNYARLRARVHR